MFEKDYLSRQIALLIEAILHTITKEKIKKDPILASKNIDEAISEATEIDGAILLSLAPESFASILSVSGVEEDLVEYICRSLELSASYLAEGDNTQLADIRIEQARCLAKAYDLDIDLHLANADKSEEYFENLSV